MEIHNRKTPHKDEGDGIDITSWENMGAQMLKDNEIVRVNEFHSDEELIKAIKKCIQNGNNAEVRKKPDGSIAVYEVKKHIVKM